MLPDINVWQYDWKYDNCPKKYDVWEHHTICEIMEEVQVCRNNVWKYDWKYDNCPKKT